MSSKLSTWRRLRAPPARFAWFPLLVDPSECSLWTNLQKMQWSKKIMVKSNLILPRTRKTSRNNRSQQWIHVVEHSHEWRLIVYLLIRFSILWQLLDKPKLTCGTQKFLVSIKIRKILLNWKFSLFFVISLTASGCLRNELLQLWQKKDLLLSLVSVSDDCEDIYC